MPLLLPDVAGYYRQVRPALDCQLAGRQVSVQRAAGDRAISTFGRTSDAAADPARDLVSVLTAALADGALAFEIVHPGWIAIQAVSGDGSDIANTATAVLFMAEAMAQDGLIPVPLTDGGDGLFLFARTDGDPAANALRYAASLATRAPELATLDRGQADGRALVRTTLSGASASVPAPYSLLRTAVGWEAVIPLHLDEVAAITAGMPSEATGADVRRRLAERGDLAAALIGDGAQRG